MVVIDQKQALRNRSSMIPGLYPKLHNRVQAKGILFSWTKLKETFNCIWANIT